MVQQLEHEIAAIATSMVTTSEQKMHSIVQELRSKIRAHLTQNRADFDRRQPETTECIAKVTADLENLTSQLNRYQPANGPQLDSVQEKLSVQFSERLSATDERMRKLHAVVEEQKKNLSDNSDLLRDLMVGIENLGENLKSINREMNYWRNPEVQEADMELQNLLDEPEIPEPTSKGSTENPLRNQSPILPQRPNVLLVLVWEISQPVLH